MMQTEAALRYDAKRQGTPKRLASRRAHYYRRGCHVDALRIIRQRADRARTLLEEMYGPQG